MRALEAVHAVLAKLRKDARGNVLLIAGAGAVALIGGAGLGVDTVQWFLWKRQLQQAVDSGALAGGNAKAQGTSGWQTYANKELQRNANTSISVVRIVDPPQEGAYTSDTGAVEVVATTSRALPFSGIFLRTPPVMRARAVATTVVGGEYCVVSLAKTGVGVKVAGTADVKLGCGVAANSADQYAFNFDGGAHLSGSPLSAVGGIDYTSSNVDGGTNLYSYGVEQNDPIAGRYSMSDVPNGPCDQTNYTINPGVTKTLTPPTTGPTAGYMRLCNGLTVRGTLNLNPGVYVIDAGKFSASSSAKIVGDGVTIILTGSSPSTVATISMAGSANVELRAPNQADDPSFPAPEWYGMLLYQDPKAAISTITNSNIMAGNSASFYDGIVYMPNAQLTYTGTSGQASDCLMLVSYQVEFNGEMSVGNTCPSEIQDIDWGTRYVKIVE